MALDFPSSPATGQTYTGSDGTTWKWDGAKWVSGVTAGVLSASQMDLGTRLAAAGTKLNALGPITAQNWPTGATTNTAIDGAHNCYQGTNANAIWNLPPIGGLSKCLTIMVEANTITTTIVPAGADQILVPGASPGTYTNAAPWVIPIGTGLTNQSVTLDAVASGGFWYLRPSPAIADAMGWVSRPVLQATYTGANAGITSGTWTKAGLPPGDITIDTHGWWDAANTRYRPKRVGIYRVSWLVMLGDQSGGATVATCYAAIYKNGAAAKFASLVQAAGLALPSASPLSVTSIMYMNGTTDYLEPYVYVTAASPTLYGGSNPCSFSIDYIGS
jgi:hypothetical protein